MRLRRLGHMDPELRHLPLAEEREHICQDMAKFISQLSQRLLGNLATQSKSTF